MGPHASAVCINWLLGSNTVDFQSAVSTGQFSPVSPSGMALRVALESCICTFVTLLSILCIGYLRFSSCHIRHAKLHSLIVGASW